MRPLPDSRTVTPDELRPAAQMFHDEGWRLITATTVPRQAGRTVLYHFERGERLRHLRIELPPDGSVPSIGSIFPGAFLVENEMRELQGLAVTDLAIDYGGRLYRDFDGMEGWAHDPLRDATSAFEAAGLARLDACVPVAGTVEVRPTTTRVPPPGAYRPAAGDEDEGR